MIVKLHALRVYIDGTTGSLVTISTMRVLVVLGLVAAAAFQVASAGMYGQLHDALRNSFIT